MSKRRLGVAIWSQGENSGWRNKQNVVVLGGNPSLDKISKVKKSVGK
jgi:hypothetical protein